MDAKQVEGTRWEPKADLSWKTQASLLVYKDV